jgi:hypothetical protein
MTVRSEPLKRGSSLWSTVSHSSTQLSAIQDAAEAELRKNEQKMGCYDSMQSGSETERELEHRIPGLVWETVGWNGDSQMKGLVSWVFPVRVPEYGW